MGRRSRKRTDESGHRRVAAQEQSAVERDDAARRSARAGASRREQAPEPPWGRFPLVELCVLAAIGLGVAGVIVGGRPGNVLLTGAVLMGSVAGLEVALREHLGGYRSHTLVLSATMAVPTMAVLFFADVDRGTMVPIAAGVFGAAFLGWRTLFKHRSGGFGVKVR